MYDKINCQSSILCVQWFLHNLCGILLILFTFFINYFKVMTGQSIVAIFIFLNVLEKEIILKFYKI